MEAKEFGRFIAGMRKEKKMTQAELARELDISASSIGMYEQGRREPDKEMFLRLSRYFGVPVEYLMDDSVKLDEPMEFKDFIEKWTNLFYRPKITIRSSS